MVFFNPSSPGRNPDIPTNPITKQDWPGSKTTPTGDTEALGHLTPLEDTIAPADGPLLESTNNPNRKYADVTQRGTHELQTTESGSIAKPGVVYASKILDAHVDAMTQAGRSDAEVAAFRDGFNAGITGDYRKPASLPVIDETTQTAYLRDLVSDKDLGRSGPVPGSIVFSSVDRTGVLDDDTTAHFAALVEDNNLTESQPAMSLVSALALTQSRNTQVLLGSNRDHFTRLLSQDPQFQQLPDAEQAVRIEYATAKTNLVQLQTSTHEVLLASGNPTQAATVLVASSSPDRDDEPLLSSPEPAHTNITDFYQRQLKDSVGDTRAAVIAAEVERVYVGSGGVFETVEAQKSPLLKFGVPDDPSDPSMIVRLRSEGDPPLSDDVFVMSSFVHGAALGEITDAIVTSSRPPRLDGVDFDARRVSDTPT